MHVELNRVDEDFHFKGKGFSGVELDIDGAEAIGGHNAGARPMETVLIGLGSCSAIDIIQILKKQKQNIKSFKIEIEGERANAVPSVFTKIHLKFLVAGEVEEVKLKRAIDLSVDKYCSVAAMLNKTAEITHSYEIIK